jgi:hypothetical protein
MGESASQIAARKRWSDPAYRYTQTRAIRAAKAAVYRDADAWLVPQEALHITEWRDGIPAELSARWDRTMKEHLS